MVRIEKEKPVEEINHPSRYGGDGTYECQKVIREWTKDLKGIEAVNVGHVLRYICRYREKQPIASLKKLIWYVNDLIAELERQGFKE